MITALYFWEILKSRNLTFFSGVPDSTFGVAYNHMVQDPDVRYVPAVREDVALGIASAAYFADQLGGVMMQNSGFGNIVNALTSFNLLYRIPALLIVGWRGYGGEPNDAPEHWIMGGKTTEFLRLLDVPFVVFSEDSFEQSLDELLSEIKNREIPGVILVRAGEIE